MKAVKQKTGKTEGTQAFLKFSQEPKPAGVQNPKPLDYVFEMDYVYGFAGAGGRNQQTLYFGKDTNEIIYPCAALGVAHNIADKIQRIFGGGEKEREGEKYIPNWPTHQDDITCLDISHNETRNIIATGECGKFSTVHVWDTTTMKSIAQFNLGDKAKGVACVAISPCQRYVVASDQSGDHNVYIYNIQRKKMLLNIAGGSDAILGLAWSKKPNDLRFIAQTASKLIFWCPADASKKLFRNATFGQKFTQTKFGCGAFDEDGIAYAGGANGGVHVFDQKGELGLVLKAHAKPVTSVACAQGILVSSGQDDMISVFSCDQGEYQFLRQIALDEKSFAPSIDVLNGKILCGVDNGKIITVNVDGSNKEIHSTTHCNGEAWGLHVIQEKGTFLTCADDNNFFEYSISEKKLLRSGKIWMSNFYGGKPYEAAPGKTKTASTMSTIPTHQQGRAIAHSSKLNHIALSNNFGDIAIIDYNDWSKRIALLLQPKEWNEVMTYSPCGGYFAAGSHDNAVYVWKIQGEEYTLIYNTKLTHSSGIQCIDWSRDSKFLRAVDMAYEKITYNLAEQRQAKDGEFDNTNWATITCKLGWDVIGVYPKGADGTDINAVDVILEKGIVAASDDFGSVTVFKYPVLSQSQQSVRMTGHSEHVARVRFYDGPQGTYMITAGGNDRTYIQWKGVQKASE